MKSPPTWAAGAGERRRSALALHKEKKRAQDVFHSKSADGKDSSVPVTVGVESNGMIVVLSGLKEGQIVITPDAPASK